MNTSLILTSHGVMAGVRDMVICVAVLLGLTSVAHCGSGCLPTQTPNAKEQSYTAAIVGCAAKAKTKAEDHACRVAVNKAFGLCEGNAGELPGDCE